MDGPDEFAAALDRWTAYYRELGIEALAYGALVLRRRDGVNWSRGASLPPRPLEPASSHLLRMFAGVDAAAAGPDALLARRLAVAPAARFEQVVSPGDGWTVVERRPLARGRARLPRRRRRADAAAAAGARRHAAPPARRWPPSLGEDELPRAAELLRGMLETGFLIVA